MALAYYAVEAARAFWDEHWAAHSLAEARAAAEASPLTRLIEAGLPRGGRVLEAGCGLAQYVLLLGERGWRAIGADWSLTGLGRARAEAGALPLAAMDLRTLAFRPGCFDACLSLGVVEHDPAGPDALLDELRRVLRPGGVLLVSVPYVNGCRRALAWEIRRRQAGIARAGGRFYQFAFGRGEFRRRLEARGFRVTGATPYDPARLLRRGYARTRARLGDGRGRAAGAPVLGRAPRVLPSGAPASTESAARRLARRVLYSPPLLALLGHMILFTAVRESDA
jgi:SAM-dependent methyltransferase